MPAACGCAPRWIPVMQDAAAEALREGLAKFDGGRGWRDLETEHRRRRRLARRSSTARRSAPAFPTGARRWCCRRAAARRAIGFTNGSTGDACRAPRRRMPKRGVGGAAFDYLQPGHDHHRQAKAPATAMRCARSPRSAGGIRRRGSAHRPRAGDAGRLRRRRRRATTARPRRCASRARRSSRSSMRPRSKTA